MIEFIEVHWWTILVVFNYIVAISAAFFIIQKNYNPTKTLSYILILVIMPFLGVLVYYLFGQEYRKNKIFSKKNILNRKVVKRIQDELKITEGELDEIEDELDEKSKLIKLLYKNDRSKLTKYNKVQLLIDGKEKFDRLFKDIKQAKSHIHLEYYIFRDDTIGTQLIDLLCEKAKEGVKVRLSFDDVGSKVSGDARTRMKDHGIEYYEFMPVRFPKFTGKLNYRNHRKIVVIDGKIGYVGGINVSDTYVNSLEDNNNFDYWRDTHVRIEGDAVKSLQILFLSTWEFVSNSTVKVSDNLFPRIELKQENYVQIAASGPDTDWANIMEAVFIAITNAEDYVYITTPYFIPNDEVYSAILIAARSGIDVRLIIPKISDSKTAQYATNSYIDTLLEAGVKVYQYTKGFIHAKTIAIDDIFATIGTANMDYRSFKINFEVNAMIYDEQVCKDLKSVFLKDIEHTNLIDKETWAKRSKIERFLESFCRLWAPLL